AAGCHREGAPRAAVAARHLLVVERTAHCGTDVCMGLRARARPAHRSHPWTTCAGILAGRLPDAQVPAAHARLSDLAPDTHGVHAARAVRVHRLLDRRHHRACDHHVDALAASADEHTSVAGAG